MKEMTEIIATPPCFRFALRYLRAIDRSQAEKGPAPFVGVWVKLFPPRGRL
jgi:hypothetical protein